MDLLLCPTDIRKEACVVGKCKDCGMKKLWSKGLRPTLTTAKLER